MNAFRRAAPTGTGATAPRIIRTVAGAVTALGAVAAALWSVVTVVAARRVVTPAPAPADTMIRSVDVAAQTIVLSRTPQTELPGRYGLVTSGRAPYIKVGTVLSMDERTVTRKLLTQIRSASDLSARARFSGWYHWRPEQLHVPLREVAVPTELGPAPAWFFPAGTPEPDPRDEATSGSRTWAILVHGRGTTRGECLRAVPVLHPCGVGVLVISYRNDTEAPRSPSGTYGLGASEARDVDAAISFARAHGADRVVLMGWSMGGAAVLQCALHSSQREWIAGIILDSPVIAWRDVLRAQARSLHLPVGITAAVMHLLSGTVWRVLTGGEAIPFPQLDVLAHADRLRHPTLILHSDDDTFVPAGPSHELARRRADIVHLESFTVAAHTKLWNTDPQRWEDAISSWMQALVSR